MKEDEHGKGSRLRNAGRPEVGGRTGPAPGQDVLLLRAGLQEQVREEPRPVREVTEVEDVVCGMTIDPADAVGTLEHGGRRYYFCSQQCLERFRDEPARYISGTPAPEVPAPAGAKYTCPMHPEIVRDGPGSCPICGMALEPRTVSLDNIENPELTDMSRRFWVSVALTIPVLALAMGSMLFPHALSGVWRLWIEGALATPVVLWGGWPFFVRGVHSVRNHSLNMFTLIALGVGVAYLFSLVALLFPGLFPASFRGHGGAVAVY